ncbi:glycosyltransferase [Methylophaga pinxianii]|uniref:glycosyltransferase n=1 Tax=Methylophaga pinxianii TaxID=2881052 RepID=UPI001CF5C50E|nr:glycosyltransferase [Methylophaga pinxianii]MCB2427791.1 glycosyltransferase [Methylophaga pinxianii]UPH45604.1 glycosyltransferase [Methylophaga pinxianii]
MSVPLVSVCIITYQHKDYIKQCLDGVLSQKTDFPFEILIGEDGSVDGTREICEAYAERYPDIIRLFCWDRNTDRSQFSGGPGRYNIIHTLQQVKSPYIALCEGDDYWTDEYKLQHQVTFLQSHADYSMSFHEVNVDENGHLSPDNLTKKQGEDFSIDDLARGNFIHTPSVVYRNVFPTEFPAFFLTSPVLDYVLHLYVAQKGKIKYFAKPMATYRIHSESYWSSRTQRSRSILWLKVLSPLVEFFSDNTDVVGNLKQQAFDIGSNLIASQTHPLSQEELKTVLTNLVSIDPAYFFKLHLHNWKDMSLEQLIKLFQTNLQHTDLGVQTLVKAIVNKNLNWLTSHQLKDTFVLSAVQLVLNELEKDASFSLLANSHQEASIRDCLQLLTPVSLNEMTDSALQLKLLLRQMWEGKRYEFWINNHALMEIDAQIHAERMMQWSNKPTFHLYMFVFKEEQNLLADTLASLGQQFYQNWKLTVIADSPSPDAMFEELDVLEWLTLPNEVEPYDFLNSTMSASTAEWLGFIPAGTCFEPQIWLQFGDYINLSSDKAAFYCDDDIISSSGKRSKPRFKPDFNLDLLRSQDYIGPILCKRTLFEAVGGFDKVPGHENMSLAFKIFERVGADGIGHIADILMHLPETSLSLYSTRMSQQAVQQHLIRQQVPAVAEEGLVDNAVRVVYQWPTTPKVSIIIPTKDKLEFLRPCVEAALYRNNYPNVEVIVVNNLSEEVDTLAYFDELKERPGIDLVVIDYPKPFNYAAISNLAAQQAKGEYLLFLNNDTEALHPEWLERMMSHAQRPEVGVVGARLVYPETGMLQHAGVIMGMTYVADHHFMDDLNIREPGYMNRAQLDQNFSAVTGACLLIRKSLYEDVGGMNEIDLAVLYNDVDLCLKVRETNHLVVWTPYAVLVHHGSVSQKSEYLKPAVIENSRNRAKTENRYMLKTWMKYIANDPASNRHLSLAYRDLRIESEIPTNWDTNFHDRPRVLGLPLKGGSGQYRVIQPFSALSLAGIAQCEYYLFNQNTTRPILISEYARVAPDAVVFQAAINDIQLFQLEQLHDFLPDILRVYTIDDLLTNVPEQSPAHKELKRHFYDVKTRLRKALQFSNRLIVSTQPLADLCSDMIDDIRIIPNRLPKDPWLSLSSLQNQGQKPRVGWAGAQQHQGDLAIMIDIVKATADEVDWVFMGMCPDEIKPYVHEYHHFVPMNEYPAKLASLNLDLAVAPLEIHPFNESKSNLRLLEYGVLGWPVICTDIYPYQTNNPPVIRVKNEVDEWVAAIRQILADKAALAHAGTALKSWVLEHYMLEDHLDEWLEALVHNS